MRRSMLPSAKQYGKKIYNHVQTYNHVYGLLYYLSSTSGITIKVQSSLIMYERRETSLADISKNQQLTPKQSRCLNSTKRKNIYLIFLDVYQDASANGHLVLHCLVFIFLYLSVLSCPFPIQYSWEELLNIRKSTGQSFSPLFNESEIFLNLLSEEQLLTMGFSGEAPQHSLPSPSSTTLSPLLKPSGFWEDPVSPRT